jgi:hypothetical protein
MRRRYRIERALPRTTVLSNHRWLYLQSFDSLFRNDRNHGIDRPKAERSVEQQSAKKNARQIGTKLRLFCVRVHSCTPERMAHFSRRFIELPFASSRHLC